MTVIDFDSLDLGDRLGKGGQGSVYRVDNQQINQQWAVVYKEYLPSILPTVRINALRQMVDLVPTLPFDDGIWLAGETSWPAALVEKHGAVSGFLMRAVPDEFQFAFQSLGASGVNRKLANVEFLLNEDAYVAGIGLRVSERDRLLLLAALAETLDRLRRLDIAVGDLSPKNLLFSTGPKVKCFVIDCDAMRLRGVSVMEQVETPGWQIPRGEERATRHSDAFKFGLLAVRLFARDQASKDPGPLARISPALGTLAGDSLSDDVDRRPPPGGWIDDLKIAASKASTSHATATAAHQVPGPTSSAGTATQTQIPRAAFNFAPPVAPAQPTVGPIASPLVSVPATPPGMTRRPRAIAVGVILLVAAVGAGIGIHAATQTSGSGNTANSGSSSLNPYASDAPSQPASSAEAPSPSAPPTAVGLVQIVSDIAADPRADQVAEMLDTYFSGIDQKNYSQALAEYDPSGVVNPGDSSQVQQFETGVSTSDDTDIRLVSIQPGDQSSAVTGASITFQSTQAAGMGPGDDPSETCTDWSLTYALTQSASGSYLINNTPVASHHAC